MSWRWAGLADLPLAHWVGQASGCVLRLMLSWARLDLISVATTASLLSPAV